jgi:poly(A) polymerase
VTGVDRIFFTVGVKGVWSGVYDPGVPGKIRWDDHSETGDVASRPLAMIEANNCLLFSSGKLIYRRNDGASPSYTIVHDMSDLYPGNVIPAVG